MTARAIWCELSERLGWADTWWRDVTAYYGVDRRTAIRLGTRAKDRRPDLPGSPTCQPVSGKTWEELWAAQPRETPEQIESFWQEVGSWCVFRQLVRHRGRGFWDVLARLPMGGTLLEYGCGIAPVTWWLSRRGYGFTTILKDVPSEALTFGAWRLGRIPWAQPQAVIPHTEGVLPPCDVAVVLEVLEHVPSPIRALEAILGALRPDGWLLEDFHAHHGAGSPADLESAARERPKAYELIRDRCIQMTGQPPEAPDGGGRRWWVKRS